MLRKIIKFGGSYAVRLPAHLVRFFGWDGTLTDVDVNSERIILWKLESKYPFTYKQRFVKLYGKSFMIILPKVLVEFFGYRANEPLFIDINSERILMERLA